MMATRLICGMTLLLTVALAISGAAQVQTEVPPDARQVRFLERKATLADQNSVTLKR
jgi:hypothetical protein